MNLLHLEKLSGSRYEDLLHEAEVERMMQATTRHEPQRAWALGRGLVRLGHTFERFGHPGHTLS